MTDDLKVRLFRLLVGSPFMGWLESVVREREAAELELKRLRAEKTIAGGTSKDWMETAYRRGVIDEREACAQLCEQFATFADTDPPPLASARTAAVRMARDLAAAIRARGET